MAGPIEAKFHMESPWDGRTKVVQTVLVTWPRRPSCPYMLKPLKNLLRNQKADDLETWNVALGGQVIPSLFKWWPWIDHDLFYGKVKFVPLCVCMGKGKTMDFSETIVVYDLKLATDDRSNKKFLLSLGAVCPLPRGYIHVLNHAKIV